MSKKKKNNTTNTQQQQKISESDCLHPVLNTVCKCVTKIRENGMSFYIALFHAQTDGKAD